MRRDGCPRPYRGRKAFPASLRVGSATRCCPAMRRVGRSPTTWRTGQNRPEAALQPLPWGCLPPAQSLSINKRPVPAVFVLFCVAREGAPWRKPGRSRRSWSRTSSATAGSPARTRTARWRGSGALRSDLIDPAIAVHHGRIVKRTGDGIAHRVPQRGRRRALRDRSAERPHRAQRRRAARDAASNSASAFISATSSRRATAT